VQANRAAFAHYAIYPRLLRDVTGGSTRLMLLGRELAHPILLAPVAFQKLVHPQGELETARAAAATDTPLVCSTLATQRLEDVAAAAGPQRWFQLYFQARRAATLDLVRRAEAAGYTALVVTVDAAIQLPSFQARRSGFVMPEACRAVNLAGYEAPSQVQLATGKSVIFQGYMREAPTWDDLAWLQQQTPLPLLVKGILHPADARRVQSMGIAGLVVSNHGGRALDESPASLRVLPAIRAAVGDDFPLLFDSGIRSGSDVFKALALGANAVMVGRLQMYALGVAGALGVAHMLRLLREELEACMAQAGCASLGEITSSALYTQPSAMGQD
jgi:isopentenyl diphosphate isomerase/L-lactate dehydrogenase-like FMN-dependent dehydrogenase